MGKMLGGGLLKVGEDGRSEYLKVPVMAVAIPGIFTISVVLI